MTIKDYKILHGDVLEMMCKIPNASVDCIVTSPPYWQKRDYGFKSQWGLEQSIEQYLEHLTLLMKECKRVLKDTGTVFINLGDTYHNSKKWTKKKSNVQSISKNNNRNYRKDKIQDQGIPQKCLSMLPARFAIKCIEEGWILRNDIIWAKTNGMPESVKDRFSTRHEHIFFFVKNQQYYFDLDLIREEYSLSSIQRSKYGHSESPDKSVSINRSLQPKEFIHPKGKNPSDVSDFWKIATKGNRDKHYAGFNTALISKPILAGCPKGGIILDPFCGRGTTGMKALQEKRKFIGIDGNKQYCNIAEKNLKNVIANKNESEVEVLSGLRSPLDGLGKLNKTPITYYGGKQNLIKHILPLIPAHNLYCEPFVGGAAVFFAKQPSSVEVINDLDGRVVNFYKVCKLHFRKLQKRIQATPHSRKVHNEAKAILQDEKEKDSIKKAWAFWVQTNMSFSARINGGYAYERKSNRTTKTILNKKNNFTQDICDRLNLVDIECNDALKVIKSRDAEDSFFYIDPPYYNSDMGHYDGYSLKDFTDLLEVLSQIKGKFLLSSYPSAPLSKYTKRNKWVQLTKEQTVSVTNGKRDKKKIEVFTANYDIKKMTSTLHGITEEPDQSILLHSKALRLQFSFHNCELKGAKRK